MTIFVYMRLPLPLTRLIPIRCLLESTPDNLHHNLQTHVLHQCLLHHAIWDQVMIFPLLFAKVNATVLTLFLLLFPITNYLPPYVLLLHLDSISILNTVHEALSHPGWRNAMIEEMTAFDDNGTRDLVSRLQERKLVVVNWCFLLR